ncbi:DUF4190 domain-containing protein [Aeromicrobium sp. NPDC092404]|uniref:DUF4190 domain-containing protein n=1 Tax=Aeromicrobium sp. NPDC092404 TaxID=3154976 RepID=UPI003441FA53
MTEEQPGNAYDPPPPGYQPPPGSYGQQPPNWGSAYPPPPQYPPPGYGPPHPGFSPPPPKHGQATAAMIFGIVSLAGLVTCFLPILLAPVAWILGAKAVKEIDANPGAYSGRGEASAGKIMGIVGTCLLVLALLVVTVIIIIGVNGGFDDDPYYDDPYYSDSIVGILR